MVNVLVWDNGNNKSLVEVVVNQKVVYSVSTFNLFCFVLPYVLIITHFNIFVNYFLLFF